jgi:acetolactate synthase small subunit
MTIWQFGYFEAQSSLVVFISEAKDIHTDTRIITSVKTKKQAEKLAKQLNELIEVKINKEGELIR